MRKWLVANSLSDLLLSSSVLSTGFTSRLVFYKLRLTTGTSLSSVTCASFFQRWAVTFC